MRSKLVIGMIVVLIFCFSTPILGASQTGTLELKNVPDTVQAGRYDSKSGIFSADLSEVPDAYVQITFEDMVLRGKVLHWNTEDDYMRLEKDAELTKDDFDLTADQIEYFGDIEKLIATGNVVAVAEDATIEAELMEYYETTDEAHFLRNVLVKMDDGSFRGERFVMYVELEKMEFFGPFTGEFVRKSQTEE